MYSITECRICQPLIFAAAAAVPAAKAVAQAICRLNPPVYASTSMTSPAKNKPGHNFDSIVFDDGEKLEKWLMEDPERQNNPITMVFQTTQTKKVFNFFINHSIFCYGCKCSECRENQRTA